MSDWPKRYKCNILDGRIPVMMQDGDGEYVSKKDFERLLEHCADRLDRSDCYADLLHSQIKREILYELSKEAEND